MYSAHLMCSACMRRRTDAECAECLAGSNSKHLPEGLGGSDCIHDTFVIAISRRRPGICECLHPKSLFRQLSFKTSTLLKHPNPSTHSLVHPGKKQA